MEGMDLNKEIDEVAKKIFKHVMATEGLLSDKDVAALEGIKGYFDTIINISKSRKEFEMLKKVYLEIEDEA